MKHLFTTALVTAAFALPLAAAAQERYPTLNPDQLSPAQKAYVDGLQKPPRNNTTALEEPALQGLYAQPRARQQTGGGVGLRALGVPASRRG